MSAAEIKRLTERLDAAEAKLAEHEAFLAKDPRWIQTQLEFKRLEEAREFVATMKLAPREALDALLTWDHYKRMRCLAGETIERIDPIMAVATHAEQETIIPALPGYLQQRVRVWQLPVCEHVELSLRDGDNFEMPVPGLGVLDKDQRRMVVPRDHYEAALARHVDLQQRVGGGLIRVRPLNERENRTQMLGRA